MAHNSESKTRGFAVVRSGDQWLRFTRATKIFTSRNREEVVGILERVQQAVGSGQYAAGFLAYEAAGAFDNALVTHDPHDFPLIWFGIYDNVETLTQLQAPVAMDNTCWTPSVGAEDYCKSVRQIKQEIVAGNTYQVNYSFRQRSHYSHDAYGAFVTMTEHHATPYAAFINTGEFAISSLSPELFFALNGDQITCRPMKGTAPRGKSNHEDSRLKRELRLSDKNRAENLMIVDMIRNDLGRIAESGSVKVEHLFSVETYETLFQMTTTVSAMTRVSLPEIFTALFPSASITGAPKVNTMTLIRQLEPEPRDLYTGTIGFISPDHRAQFNVAIRTLIIDLNHSQATYGAGSGIVWDSDPLNEYEECMTKTRIVSEASEPFALLETLRWSNPEGYYLLDYHLNRLRASAIRFLFRYDEAHVKKQLALLAADLGQGNHRIRLTLNKDGEVRLESAPLPAPERLRVTLANKAIDRNDRFLYHKTTMRSVYDSYLAAHPNFDDVLLFNADGELTESCIANIVVVKNAQHFTPPVDCGLLGGTYRQFLIDEGRLKEQQISKDTLADYDDIYLINSVRGRIDIDLVN